MFGRQFKMIGIDMIDIEDIDKSEKFLKEIATESEIEYVQKSFCESLRHQRTGALLCVKDAVIKALELNKKQGVSYKDIELSHEKSGKPIVILHGKALEKYNQDFIDKKIEVSLSHTPKTAVAIAILF